VVVVCWLERKERGDEARMVWVVAGGGLAGSKGGG